MPISVLDQKHKLEECLFGNPLINYIFGNIILVSIIIVIFNIAVLYLAYTDNASILKLFIWMSASTFIIVILHNKTLKLEYLETIKTKGNEDFKTMMDNNANKKNDNKGGFNETDIITFLR